MLRSIRIGLAKRLRLRSGEAGSHSPPTITHPLGIKWVGFPGGCDLEARAPSLASDSLGHPADQLIRERSRDRQAETGRLGDPRRRLSPVGAFNEIRDRSWGVRDTTTLRNQRLPVATWLACCPLAWHVSLGWKICQPPAEQPA